MGKKFRVLKMLVLAVETALTLKAPFGSPKERWPAEFCIPPSLPANAGTIQCSSPSQFLHLQEKNAFALHAIATSWHGLELPFHYNFQKKKKKTPNQPHIKSQPQHHLVAGIQSLLFLFCLFCGSWKSASSFLRPSLVHTLLRR